MPIARLLLERGAEVNARNRDGRTPLHDAAVSGHREMAELLIAAGADLEARDSESGVTPLYEAASWGRAGVLELLIAKGADINATNKSGASPLQAAVTNGFEDAARLLRAHGAK